MQDRLQARNEKVAKRVSKTWNVKLMLPPNPKKSRGTVRSLDEQLAAIFDSWCLSSYQHLCKLVHFEHQPMHILSSSMMSLLERTRSMVFQLHMLGRPRDLP